jgi:hypothetical protein
VERIAAASFVVLFALGVTSLDACRMHKTKRGFRVGTGCEKMDESCSSGATANLCSHNALTTVSCKGPKGCVDAPPDDVACDQSIAAEGDGCIGDDDACTAAKDALLQCKDGKFAKARACPSHACSIVVTKTGLLTETTTDCH